MYKVDDLKLWIELAEKDRLALAKARDKAIADYQQAEAKLKHLRGLVDAESRQSSSQPESSDSNEGRNDSAIVVHAGGERESQRFARSPRNIVSLLRQSAKKILGKSGPLSPDELYVRLPAEIRDAMERSESRTPPVARMARYLGMANDFRFHKRVNRIAVESSREDDLEAWIQESRGRFDEVRREKATGKNYGLWSVGYTIDAPFEPPHLKDLREMLKQVVLPYTGWAVWFVPTSGRLPIYPTGASIECWLDDEWDFWRVSRFGMAYMVRPFQEDFLFDNSLPGKEFDLTIPIWRIGECLLHAQRMTEALAKKSGEITINARWEGLAGRKLITRASPDRILRGDYFALADSADCTLSVDTSVIQSNLPDLVQELTDPLYTAFDFLKPQSTLFREEIEKMQKSNVGA